MTQQLQQIIDNAWENRANISTQSAPKDVVEAEDVADEIVEAMEVPRFDVFVPRANGVLYKILSPLPRSWREALGRAMKVDKLMIEVDQSARRAYEERAAKSEPGQEADEETPAPQRDAA